jgi:hypothetical protein
MKNIMFLDLGPVWLPIFKTCFRVCKTKIVSPTKKKKMLGTPFLHFVLQNKCVSVVGPPCFSKLHLAVLACFENNIENNNSILV